MRRYLTKEAEQRLRSALERNLGDEVVAALADPTISEILINEDGWVRLKGVGFEGSRRTESRLSDASVKGVIQAVAHAEGANVGEHQSILEANLPFYGSRFTGILPPVVLRPVMVIRKPAGQVFTLDDYVGQERLHPDAREHVGEAVERRDNILIVGATHSGKTTFANAVLHEVSRRQPKDRLYVIEDVRELQCRSEDVTSVATWEGADRETLLRTALRMSPDRIVLGEVRGPEAATLLKSWNTGHCGLCTVHADSAYDGLLKIEELAAEAMGGVRPRAQVARAVGLVVFMASVKGRGPCVRTLVSVSSGLAEDGSYVWDTLWE